MEDIKQRFTNHPVDSRLIKEQQREDIAMQTKEFLSKRKKITEYKMGETSVSGLSKNGLASMSINGDIQYKGMCGTCKMKIPKERSGKLFCSSRCEKFKIKKRNNDNSERRKDG